MNRKNNKICSSLFIAALFLVNFPLLTSCSDWLDVEPETQVREETMYGKYKGFQDALIGCYAAMADRDIYGQKLTMDDIEMLACLWDPASETDDREYYYLYEHDYSKSEAQEAIKDIYEGLYNVVVNANNIMAHIESEGSIIPTQQARDVIEGECLAIRAFCQLDILRLFGQMPNNAQRSISLPYAEKPSIKDLPNYYGYNDYVRKLENDLNRAEQLFAQSDPCMQYDYTSLNQQGGSPANLDDEFLLYRQFRMNIWAVKAIKARMYMYIGDTANAYKYAKEVIDAKVGGSPVIQLAKGDLDASNNYYALPSECLFALGNSQLIDYSIDVLGGYAMQGLIKTSSTSNDNRRTCYVSPAMLTQLFTGRNLSSNNRYLRVWEQTSLDVFGGAHPTIRKYYYNTAAGGSVSVLRTKRQIMPLVRLSEQYLIAMEATTSLSEANELYKTYMVSHEENITTDFESKEELQAEIINEYRREFYGEGVMFYTYKRLGISNPLWCRTTMGDSQYALPLPSTEYNPN